MSDMSSAFTPEQMSLLESVKKTSLWNDIISNEKWKRYLFLGCSGGIFLTVVKVLTAKEWFALSILSFIGSAISKRVFGENSRGEQLFTILSTIFVVVALLAELIPWPLLVLLALGLVVLDIS